MAKIIYISITKKEADTTWKKWKKEHSTLYRSLKKQCVQCFGTENLQIHHIDGDKTHNEAYNLECLCSNCHRKLHNKLFSIRYKEEYIPQVKCRGTLKRKKRPTADELIKKYVWNGKRWVRR